MAAMIRDGREARGEVMTVMDVGGDSYGRKLRRKSMLDQWRRAHSDWLAREWLEVVEVVVNMLLPQLRAYRLRYGNSDHAMTL